MAEVTLGGDRLGSGKKEKVHLRNYERSTHNLGYVWRSTMSAGTLVPFLTEVALPGDIFDIDLNASILTHPTIGPLFGSYKVQIDVFQAPMRLYQGKLHMNMLNIGMDMSNVKLPQIVMEVDPEDEEEIQKMIEDGRYDNSQVNPSSIFSHLNIRGVGRNTTEEIAKREFNAIPWLAYWDIYKNYYANKQEEIGMVIHNPISDEGGITPSMVAYRTTGDAHSELPKDGQIGEPGTGIFKVGEATPEIYVHFEGGTKSEAEEYTRKIVIGVEGIRGDIPEGIETYEVHRGTGVRLVDFMKSNVWAVENDEGWTVYLDGSNWEYKHVEEPAVPWEGQIYGWTTTEGVQAGSEVNISQFELSNIDEMRMDILANVRQEGAITITKNTRAPYGLALQSGNNFYDERVYARQGSQEGLALKTYQSDLFNNWISTEWIDGDNGINAITSLSTTEDFITIDQINLSRKIYDMLNRIAISGGTYDNWLDATYTHERAKSVENPIYMGGLSQELVFEEVISNAESDDQPLGTLAGRGVMDNKRKGGHVKIKVDEPSYIMAIISLTPRVDYSQGNKWDTHLKTMDDFHKPALDEIGFQDLITEQMAWFETTIGEDNEVTQKSIGKQPAWINYMTNVNTVRGNFAEPRNQMWMTLNRKYEIDEENHNVKDLTTYIDPSKFNHIFADTKLDAQNFWAQINIGMKVRRKMSAKVMPNL